MTSLSQFTIYRICKPTGLLPVVLFGAVGGTRSPTAILKLPSVVSDNAYRDPAALHCSIWSQGSSIGLETLVSSPSNTTYQTKRLALDQSFCLVPSEGLEPSRDCSHTHLKRTCIPIPPRRHSDELSGLNQTSSELINYTQLGVSCQALNMCFDSRLFGRSPRRWRTSYFLLHASALRVISRYAFVWCTSPSRGQVSNWGRVFVLFVYPGVRDW